MRIIAALGVVLIAYILSVVAELDIDSNVVTREVEAGKTAQEEIEVGANGRGCGRYGCLGKKRSLSVKSLREPESIKKVQRSSPCWRFACKRTASDATFKEDDEVTREVEASKTAQEEMVAGGSQSKRTLRSPEIAPKVQRNSPVEASKTAQGKEIGGENGRGCGRYGCLGKKRSSGIRAKVKRSRPCWRFACKRGLSGTKVKASGGTATSSSGRYEQRTGMKYGTERRPNSKAAGRRKSWCGRFGCWGVHQRR